MRKSLLILTLLLTAACSQALAEQDFYGVQIADAVWARSMVYGVAEKPDATLLRRGPVVDHSIHAEASLKELDEGRLALRITVFNESAQVLATDYHFRDFFIYSRDGKRYSLIDTEQDLDLSVIAPKAKALFSPSTGNLILRNRDVTMIECSFDLGKTRVFLFPWSKKDQVTKLVSPALPVEPVKESRKKHTAKKVEEPKPATSVVAKKAETTPKPEKAVVKEEKKAPAPRETKEVLNTEGPANKTPKRNFWEWMGGRKAQKTEPAQPTLPNMPASAVAQRVDSAVIAAPPSAEAKAAGAAAADPLGEAIKKFVYVPASGFDGAGQVVAATPVVGPVTRGLVGAGTDRSSERVLINSETQQTFEWPPDRPTATQRSAVVASPAAATTTAVPATKPATKPVAKAAATPAPQKPVYADAPPARTNAQVIEYNKSYQFITINLGLKDGIKKGMVLGILHEGRLVAKAKVKQLREAVSAATILKESVRGDIQPGDSITMV